MGYQTDEYRALFSAPYHIGKTANEDVEEYRRRSPVFHVKKLQTPLLVSEHVRGLELVDLNPAEVCCGFGGTFSVKQPEISGAMVEDKVKSLKATGAERVYMHEEGVGRRRYYAEIMLFISVMYGLVIADNYLQMFIFWELVGVSSYLLIGFWFERPSAADAAKKAFIVTRLGERRTMK